MASWPFVFRWLFGIGWIVLPMLSLNLYDIRARGMNMRPPGYFAYWMIPIFDILFFPLFFAVSLGMSGSFELGMRKNWISLVVGAIAAASYLYFFWEMENRQLAAAPSSENWTVDEGGHNRYAYAHAVLMFAVVWYTVSFFVRYGMWTTVVATPEEWTRFGITVAVFGFFTVVAFAFPSKLSPNEVLSRMLGRSINF